MANVHSTRRNFLGAMAVAAPTLALPAVASARDMAPPSMEEINRQGLGAGIEATACLIEIRLALHEYRQRHGEDHWKLYQKSVGAA